jgi:hypothetical protein
MTGIRFESHPASIQWVPGYFPQVWSAARVWCWPLTPIKCQVQERAGAILTLPSSKSMACNGMALLYFFAFKLRKIVLVNVISCYSHLKAEICLLCIKISFRMEAGVSWALFPNKVLSVLQNYIFVHKKLTSQNWLLYDKRILLQSVINGHIYM